MTKAPRQHIAISMKLGMRTRDELMAADFLRGFSPSTTGLLRREYLEPGSKVEREARQALLRVLRSDEPLSRGIRRYLADLFDPAARAEDRHAVLEPRNKKQKVYRSAASAQVADYVDQWSKTEGPVKAAEFAALRFGVSRKRIFELLGEQRKPQRRSKKSPTVTPKRK